MPTLYQRLFGFLSAPSQEPTKEISIADPRVHTVTGRIANTNYLVRSKGLTAFDAMRRDDQVKAAMAFKKLAVLKSGWTIDSPEEMGDDWEIAEFVRTQFKKLPGTFDESIKAIMTGLDYGYSVSEKIYYEITAGKFSGKLGLKAIKTRAPHNIEFETDPGGNILEFGIVQMSNRMPRSKFIVFTNDGEFGNPYGRSDLEAAYRAYFSKENSYKWLLMALERFGIDPLIVTYNSNSVSKSIQDGFNEVLRRLQAATVASVPRKEKDDIVFWQPQQSGPMVDAFVKVLEFYNRDIARSLLMPGLLGFTSDESTGSLARSETHFEAFMLVVESIRKTIAEDVVQEQIIKQLVDLNYGPQEFYPQFSFLPLTEDIQTALLTTWSGLVSSGVVKQGSSDEAHIREMLKFPERAEGDIIELPPKPTPSFFKNMKDETRPLTLSEKRVNFKALVKKFDSNSEEWTEKLKKALGKILRDASSKIKNEFDGKAATINEIEFGFGDRLKEAIKSFLESAYRQGRKDLNTELRTSKKFINDLPNVDPEDAIAYLEAKALNISGVLEQRIVNDARQAMLSGLSAGKSNAEIIESLAEIFAPYVGGVVAGEVVEASRLETIVRTNLTDAYNQGRLVQGKEAGDLLEGWQYSAIMDDRTTDICQELDGKVFLANDDSVDSLKPPRHFNCRSILVPIIIGDEYDADSVMTSDDVEEAIKMSGKGF